MLAAHDVQAFTAARRTPAQTYGYVSIGLMLFACLFLQRFVVPFGDLRLNVTTVLMFALVPAGVIAGAFSVSTRSLALYMLFVAGTLLATLISLELDRRILVRTSMPSLLHMLAVYAPF